MTLRGEPAGQDALDLAERLAELLAEHPNDQAGRDAARRVLAQLDAAERDQPIPEFRWAGDYTPPERKWLIDRWLPANRVTLFPGVGGIGKSRLILQLAAGIASGGGEGDAWIDAPAGILALGNAIPANGAPVVYASYEDEFDELARRLAELSGGNAPWVTPEGVVSAPLNELPATPGGPRLKQTQGGMCRAKWRGPRLCDGPVARRRQAGSEMARSRARARLNWVSHGQRCGRYAG